MDEPKGEISNLLEDGWFFGNTLKNRSKSVKVMVRCNSDPCPCSSTKEDRKTWKISNALNRAPSLPVSLDKDKKYGAVEEEEEEEEEEEARMGDLIRQAMPSRRLDRTPSLPPLRGDGDAVQNGRKVSSSSPLLSEKGHIAMLKLVLPPKYSSKGTKQRGSNSKNRTPKLQTVSNKGNSHKSLSDPETEELDIKNVSPGVMQKLPVLQRRASLDSTHPQVSKVRRPPYLSLPLPKWGDHKASSSQQDMKAQIKFWARAVASNVRQEC